MTDPVGHITLFLSALPSSVSVEGELNERSNNCSAPPPRAATALPMGKLGCCGCGRHQLQWSGPPPCRSLPRRDATGVDASTTSGPGGCHSVRPQLPLAARLLLLGD